MQLHLSTCTSRRLQAGTHLGIRTWEGRVGDREASPPLFTGLFVDGVKEEYLDDCDDRYAKLKESSHAYIVNQFGLSCFKPVQGGAAAAGGNRKKQQGGQAPATLDGWEASTFNFYIFPEPLKDSNQVRRPGEDSNQVRRPGHSPSR